jgi:PAS domain S-box-containing protein
VVIGGGRAPGDAFADALTASVAEGVYAIDLDGRLTFMNPAAAALLGWEPDDLLGRDIHEVLHAVDRHGRRRPPEDCSLLSVVRTGVPVRVDDDVFVHRDGHLISIACSSSPIVADGEIIGAVVAFHDISDRRAAERRLRVEAQINETLLDIATTLNAQHELDAVVQVVTDAGTVVTGAAFGAFFYNVVDDGGGSYTLYTVSGVDRSAFARFPMPRKTPVFAPTFAAERTVRYDDVTAQPEYGKNPPFHGMPDGHLPVRSYLAVPVTDASGDPIGALFFGHPDASVFTPVHERLVEALAAHAAVAIRNARRFENEQRTSEALQRSMLPRELPELHGVVAVARYLPAQDGIDVGGDWYDVVPLDGGRVAVVIGDVAGHNLRAASVMGEIRNAVRAYAVEGHSPAGVVERANRFLCALVPDELATCCYVELQPSEGTATVVLAGHPPPVMAGQGAATFLHAEPGLPLGVDPGARFAETTVLLPARGLLVLYTDGLVEQPDVSLNEGLDRLVRVVENASEDLDEVADAILAKTVGPSARDDTALLLVALRGTARYADGDVGRSLPPDPGSAAAARRFVADVLGGWSLSVDDVDVAELLVSELVTNAVLHTAGGIDVRVRQECGAVRVSVADESGERVARLESAEVDGTSGRGLLLVDQLSARWGVDEGGIGKTVWFELDVARQ